MEQAIKKAIDGGYIFDNSYIQKTSPKWIVEHYSYGISSMLMDPLWWKCLGKAMNWEEDTHSFMVPTKRIERVIAGGGSKIFFRKSHMITRPRKNAIWRKEWHNFIDHISEGKDAESFFKKLQ